MRGDFITFDDVVQAGDAWLLSLISQRFGLGGYSYSLVANHEGSRNVVYRGELDSNVNRIIRIAYRSDRSREDMLAELEYVQYLHTHGGSVPNVVNSTGGNLVEEFELGNCTLLVSIFEEAQGKTLAENNYQYRDGVALSEYFHNCGKTLGKLHQLSKVYDPVHRRHQFFDKYNAERLDSLIPESMPQLRRKLQHVLERLRGIERDRESFGMIHFDFNDGNYVIDFDTGKITVFDFDNSCLGWFMYDLADLWRGGMGWTRFEKEPGKRVAFMKEYFSTCLEGYTSETRIDPAMLHMLPLFIDATLMENILDEIEQAQHLGEDFEPDEEVAYLIKCLEDGIPFMGFFHEMYSAEAPFEYPAPEK